MGEKRANPMYAWAITVPCGRDSTPCFYSYSVRHTRSHAIRDYVALFHNKTWRELRKGGDRCVRVLVTEAE